MGCQLPHPIHLTDIARSVFLAFAIGGLANAAPTIDLQDLWPGPHPQDPFEISNGVVVSSHSTLANGSNITDMFGASNSTVEATNTLFRSTGTNSVAFSTPTPIWIIGYRVWLNEDGYRRLSSFRFSVGDSAANLVQVANIPLASPFESNYGNLAIRVTDYFEPRYATHFSASFVSRSGTSFGARVNEIEAITAPSPNLGDFDFDGDLDAADIDRLLAAQAGPVPPANPLYDLNGDGVVIRTPNAVSSDLDLWVRDLRGTQYGDLDLDGKVDFADLLVLAQNYDVSLSGWASGDMDGSMSVSFADMLLLAQHYGFGTGGSPDFASDWALAQTLVPEPALAGIALAAAVKRRRR